MKKISIMLLAALMLFAFAACNNETPDPAANPIVDPTGADNGVLFSDDFSTNTLNYYNPLNHNKIADYDYSNASVYLDGKMGIKAGGQYIDFDSDAMTDEDKLIDNEKFNTYTFDSTKTYTLTYEISDIDFDKITEEADKTFYVSNGVAKVSGGAAGLVFTPSEEGGVDVKSRTSAQTEYNKTGLDGTIYVKVEFSSTGIKAWATTDASAYGDPITNTKIADLKFSGIYWSLGAGAAGNKVGIATAPFASIDNFKLVVSD